MPEEPRVAAEYLLHRTPSRTEHLISYYSKEWEMLPALLADPKTEFPYQHRAWGWGAAGLPEWNLESDVVAIFRSGHGSKDALKRAHHTHFAGAAYAPKPHPTGEDQMSLSDFLAKENDGLGDRGWLKKDDLWLLEILEETKYGAFFAEFAVDTHILFVTYFAPQTNLLAVWHHLYPNKFPEALLPALKCEDKKPFRYDGDYSKGTLAYTTTEDKLGDSVTSVTFHFDIDPDPQLKANFIVGHLEATQKSLDNINNYYADGMGNTEFYKSGYTAPPYPLPKPANDPDGKWKKIGLKPKGWLGTLVGTPQTYAQALLVSTQSMPQVVAEGLSGDEEYDPCTQWPLCPDGGDGYNVDMLTVKAYQASGDGGGS